MREYCIVHRPFTSISYLCNNPKLMQKSRSFFIKSFDKGCLVLRRL